MTATATARSRRAEIDGETRLFSGQDAVEPATTAPPGVVAPGDAVSVEDLVVEARTTYERVSARAAYQWALYGRAVIVDIRPAAQRAAEGEVHPDLRPVVIERNVLEWRLDPTSEARLDWVTPDSRVVVLCQEGYASSLAAASLSRIGLRRATDVIGGLRAWREAGLPVA
ncbi:rhodanese-like domain-containing protein [Lapillicoccus sp.]|uniref:rhodanese-like domain-containing protein n=1 Tax=Lapillicoccus sp. TaxID=1909287 RepID=UPI00344FD450